MSCKYILNYERDGLCRQLSIEDFGDAIFCEGRVFLRERVPHYINTSPGQCWGEYVDVPAGAFVDGALCERAMQLCIDDVGDAYNVIIAESLEPLRLRWLYHIRCDGALSDAPAPSPVSCSPVRGPGCITGFHENRRELLIPCEFKGSPVKRVDFREQDMEKVETLIISEGIEELALDLSDAYALKRLYIPKSAKLISPLDGISITPWFRSRKSEPLIIAGCYCGTPGGGSGGQRSLELPEGVESVAADADYHCYWHSIKTPSSLRSIGRLAFATCHCLENLNLGEGLQKLEMGAFCELKRLKSLYLPDSLKTIEQMCFEHLPLIQEVSIPHRRFVPFFPIQKLILRDEKGEELLRDSPPMLIPLTDIVSAYPSGAPFTAAGKSYEGLSQLSSHRLDWDEFSYLDVHGRKTWLLMSYDDAHMGTIKEARYIREADRVTQIERLIDGTVLVREGIGILDVPHPLRNLAAQYVFES